LTDEKTAGGDRARVVNFLKEQVVGKLKRTPTNDKQPLVVAKKVEQK
jgi:hypothetical protein